MAVKFLVLPIDSSSVCNLNNLVSIDNVLVDCNLACIDYKPKQGYKTRQLFFNI